MSSANAPTLDGAERTVLYDGLKRFLDLLVSATVLIPLAPVMLIVAYAIRRGSPGSVLYRQVRVGKDGRLFRIYKFRTMVENAERAGPQITSHDDSRITPIGRWIRHTKLDELPQLINVLRGDMSLVGPRPQVPRYANEFPVEYRSIVLAVRPGITGPTQLEFRHEEELLDGLTDRERYYIDTLLPIKCEMDADYVRNRSLGFDLLILWQTGMVFARGNYLRLKHHFFGSPEPRTVVARIHIEADEKVDVLT